MMIDSDFQKACEFELFFSIGEHINQSSAADADIHIFLNKYAQRKGSEYVESLIGKMVSLINLTIALGHIIPINSNSVFGPDDATHLKQC
jgi:hypothetical protein